MKKLFMIMVAIVAGCVVLPLWRGSLEEQQEDFFNNPACKLAQQPCPYVGDVPEIKEWKVEGNNLYLAFHSLPSDWKTVTCAAAFFFWNGRKVRTYTWAIRGCDLNNGRLNRDWRFYGYRTLGSDSGGFVNKWKYADGSSDGRDIGR